MSNHPQHPPRVTPLKAKRVLDAHAELKAAGWSPIPAQPIELEGHVPVQDYRHADGRYGVLCLASDGFVLVEPAAPHGENGGAR